MSVCKKYFLQTALAEMVELVDAPDSKSGFRNGVWVQVPLSAPNFQEI